MEQQRIIDTLLGVLAYHSLAGGSNTSEMTLMHPKVLANIKRLIDNAEYRAAVLDIYEEAFVQGNGEWFEAMKDLLGDEPVWSRLIEDIKQGVFATGTGDTPRISRS